MKNKILFPTFFLIGVYLFSPVRADSWTYDWNTRLDRDGKPAGIFQTTPFPITENSTSYSITTDEGVKTFYLGTKIFVDGGYNGGNNNGSWSKPWKKISDAISHTSSGNKTIIVRGAHGSFNGVYNETGLIPKVGVDDQHRWMIVGYGQERPIVDGNFSDEDIIQTTGQTNGYVTIQRLRLQNNNRDGVHWGADHLIERDHFNYLIDVAVSNCGAQVAYEAANGNIYYLHADNGWVYHVSSTHSLRHCVKIGDNTSNTIVEWTVAGECGYWPGIAAEKGITNYWSQVHEFPEAINFPNDAGDVGNNNIARYNIAHDGLYGAVQIRNATNFSFHHNEVYNSPRFSASGMGLSCEMGDPPCSQVQLIGYPMGGSNILNNVRIYSNVIRDSGESSATSSGVGTNSLSNSHSVYIYNNLFYNSGKSEIRLHGSSAYSTRKVHIYNNTLWHNSSIAAIYAPTNWRAGEVLIKNNIIAQLGSGKVMDLDPRIQTIDYNLYYYPNGSRGFTAGAHDFSGGNSVNPQLGFSPSGVPLVGLGDVVETTIAQDQGTNLSGFFNIDFGGSLRPQGTNWDIGAYEHFVAGSSTEPLTYTLTVEGGIISGYPSTTVEVPEGTILTIVADSLPGASFSQWMGECSFGDPYSSQTTVLMNTNCVAQPETHVLEEAKFTPFRNIMKPGDGPMEITFSLIGQTPTSIKLYDSRGQFIRPLTDQGGRVIWDGKNESGDSVASGVYTVILETGRRILKKRVVVIK